MQNIMFYILWLQSILIQKLFDGLRNLLHREFKDFLAIHGHVADLRFRIGQEIANGTGYTGKHRAFFAIGTHLHGEYAGFFCSRRVLGFQVCFRTKNHSCFHLVFLHHITSDCLTYRFLGSQHRRSRAVTKQHAGTPVAPVYDLTQHIRTDHQRRPVDPGVQKRMGRIHRKQKSRTGCADVIRHRPLRTNGRLDRTRRVWKAMIRRRSRHQDQIHVICADPGIFQSRFRRSRRQLRRVRSFRDPSLPDPRSALDPLITGLHDLGQVIIGHDPLRNTGTSSYYFCYHSCHHFTLCFK